MTTNQLLNLDYTKEENRKKIRNILFKSGILKTKDYSFDDLEREYHNLCVKNKYDTQGIKSYYESGEFKYYVSSLVMKKRENNYNVSHWIGNVYGKTFQEVLEKSIIKIYANIKKGERGDET